MATRIYEVAASMSGHCLDGRDFSGVWGLEKQFHPNRESAELACRRLQAGGGWGCAELPTYSVEERTRADYPPDPLGEQEWRHACRQAGVDPVTGEPLAARHAKGR